MTAEDHQFFIPTQGRGHLSRTSMENVSSVSRHFVLLGLVEMEDLRYLYCILSLFLYIFILLLSLGIVLVVLTEESLHEPMYIFICNLTFNGMLGSSSFFPKLIVDLLASSHQISHVGCFLQVLGMVTYAFYELSSFTLMAYDRYLAVCDPLRYATKMTNTKAVRLILSFFGYSFISVLVGVILSARVSYCGTQIKNIFCDNLSLIVLSCGDSSVNNLYGALVTAILLVFTLLIIAYSYVKIFIVCLKISKEACEKAIHTVVTHLLGFSLFLVGGLFLFIRFRLGNNNLPLFAHILLSITFIIFPPLLNPLIYGIRTKALSAKIFHHLHKMRIVSN
uniref:G-protein coupled receptors family 1 profile domain-containing protein n=1 Tax=Xenopus tropicalis TaxID=8364 RepID=A0A1B8Y8N8_XENTR|eukprot:XP_002942373.2 PREDICTED: olfactory receptor 5F1-like [Xenopus tropicalis]